MGYIGSSNFRACLFVNFCYLSFSFSSFSFSSSCFSSSSSYLRRCKCFSYLVSGLEFALATASNNFFFQSFSRTLGQFIILLSNLHPFSTASSVTSLNVYLLMILQLTSSSSLSINETLSAFTFLI